MLDSVGQRLHRARLERKITVEEAAHATKMRPERLLDLENDDYRNFPNIAYAKGFLLIYAKYLGVDVSDFASNLKTTARYGIENYEYLSNASPPPLRGSRRKSRRSVLPLVVAVLAVIATLLVVNFVQKFQRLGDLDELAGRTGDAPVGGGIEQTVAGPSPALEVLPPARPPADVTPSATAVPPAATAAENIAEQTFEVRRALPVTTAAFPPTAADAQTGAATPADGSASATFPSGHRIELQPIRKTWVKVTADGPDSTPLFEDWLYPDAPPLRFSGKKFWIELGDKEGVTIQRDGETVFYNHPGILIE